MKYCLTVAFLFIHAYVFPQFEDPFKLNAEKFKIKAAYYFHNGEISEHHFFDASGNPVESRYYFSFYSKRLRKFNACSQLIESLELDDNDCVQDKTLIIYNKRDLPVYTVLSDDEGKVIYADSTRYTKKGQEQEFIHFNKRGKIKYGFQYVYDKKDRLKLKKEFNAKKQLEYSTRFVYDQNNNLIAEIITDAFGHIDLKWESIYDPGGNEIKTTCSGACNTGGWQKKYNESGQLSEYIEFSPDGKAGRVFSYKYDGEGNKAEIILEETGKIIETQKLYYNHFHFLIKKVINENDIYTSNFEFYE